MTVFSLHAPPLILATLREAEKGYGTCPRQHGSKNVSRVSTRVWLDPKSILAPRHCSESPDTGSLVTIRNLLPIPA